MSSAAWTIDAGSPSGPQPPKPRRPARLSGSAASPVASPGGGARTAPRSAPGPDRFPRPPLPRPPAAPPSPVATDESGGDGDASSRPGLGGPPSEGGWAESGPVMGAGPYLPPRPSPAAVPSSAGYADEDGSDMLRTAPGIGRVRVCVRVRPLLHTEAVGASGSDAAPVARASSDGECLELVLARGADQETTRSFQFDRVFGPEASQEDFFERSGAKALIDNLLAGLNVSLFCYGQTGAGKTYTLSGTTERISVAAGHDALDEDSTRARPSEGLMPRAIRYLYQRLQEEQAQAEAEAEAAAAAYASPDGGSGGGSGGGGGGDGDSGFGGGGDGVGGAGATPARPRAAAAAAAAVPRVKTVVRVAMCELHNEAIFDLLNVTGEALPLRWSPAAGFFPQGQLVIATSSARDVLEVMAEGHANRSVGTHALNADSSRSHSLLTVYVERTVTMPGASEADGPAGGGPAGGGTAGRGRGVRRGLAAGGGGGASGRAAARTITVTTRSKGVFVDLAGSERLKESGSEGATATETRIINKSLFALGKVIAALAERRKPPAAGATPGAGGASAAAAAAAARARGMGSGGAGRATRSAGTAPRSGAGTRGGGGTHEDEGPHVPYRDSKLTKLLQDSLGGTSVTLMVACVSPAARFAEETMHTLRHALRARRIENAPLVQVDGKDALILSLRRENRELKAEVAALRAVLAGGGGGAAGPLLMYGGSGHGHGAGRYSRGTTSVPETPPLLALQMPMSAGSWPPSPAFSAGHGGPGSGAGGGGPLAMALQLTPHDNLRHGAGGGGRMIHASSFTSEFSGDVPLSPSPWPPVASGRGGGAASSPETPAAVGAGAFHLLRGDAPLNPLRKTAMETLPPPAAAPAAAGAVLSATPVQVPAAPAWLQSQTRATPSALLGPLSPPQGHASASAPATPSLGAVTAGSSAEKDSPSLSTNASSGALSGLHLPPSRKAKTPLAGSRGYSANAGLSAAAAGLVSPSGSFGSGGTPSSAPSSGGTTASYSSGSAGAAGGAGGAAGSPPLPPDTPHTLQELRSMARAAAAAVISAGGGSVSGEGSGAR